MLTPYNSNEDLNRIKDAFQFLKSNGALESEKNEPGYNCMKNFI